MYVCLSVRQHITGITRLNRLNFLCVLLAAVSPSSEFWRHCNTLCRPTSGFVDDVVFPIMAYMVSGDIFTTGTLIRGEQTCNIVSSV